VNTPVNSLGNIAKNLALDSQGLDGLRVQARQEPDKALKLAAKQFETVFMNMMLKSMREATPQEGMFDSEQTKMFTSMLDQQLAENMGSRGIGLADLMVQQLSRHAKTAEVAAAIPAALSRPAVAAIDAAALKAGTAAKLGTAANRASAAVRVSATAGSALPSAYNANVQQDFVQRMLPHAAIASRDTGLPAHQMIGQAAL